MTTNHSRPLRLFAVTMLMFGIMTTIHGLSPLATYGLGAVFFIFLAVFGFLIPSAMISAELATAWPHQGGVYVWVSEAFGRPVGFLATWLQWLQNLIFWTVLLTGSAAMLAIGFGAPELASNKIYIVSVVIATIWVAVLTTARGLHASSWLGAFGSIAGTILPALAMIALAAYYLSAGRENHLALDPAMLIPDLTKPGNLTFAISTIMIFSGVELMGSRADTIENAGRTLPRASKIVIFMSVALLTPMTLTIAIMVPESELNIAAGLVQAVQSVFPPDTPLGWLPAFFAVTMLIGSLGEIGGWMVGTPVSMARAGRDGFLPKSLSAHEGEVPHRMLITQGIIGSLITLFFTVAPGVQSVFWVLTALLVQLYVLMYILLFAACWRLRFSKAEIARPYRIPGGRIGVAAVCGIGLMSCLAVLVVGFIRPSSLSQMSELHYLLVIAVGFALSLAAPAFYIWKNR